MSDKLFSFFVYDDMSAPLISGRSDLRSGLNKDTNAFISKDTNAFISKDTNALISKDTNALISKIKPSNYKKKSIPKSIKINIWNTYIGDDIMKHKCFCCKRTTIKINDFEAGHILSEFNGGTNEISNFRPICRSCNLSMGTTHMEEYIKKYGLYI